MNITISPEVATLYRKQIKKVDGAGVRISLKRSGCSGWKYQTEIQPKFASTDERVCESGGILFYVPRNDVDAINGLSIALEKEGLQQMIKFSHPDIVGSCGCGESVTLKDKK